MTPEAINVAIAESLGWTDVKMHEGWSALIGSRIASDGVLVRDTIPNYFGDLNACHEMEKTLTDAECQRHFDNLSKVSEAELDALGTVYGVNHYRMYNATAPQRCEAYMRTKGLWEE